MTTTTTETDGRRTIALTVPADIGDLLVTAEASTRRLSAAKARSGVDGPAGGYLAESADRLADFRRTVADAMQTGDRTIIAAIAAAKATVTDADLAELEADLYGAANLIGDLLTLAHAAADLAPESRLALGRSAHFYTGALTRHATILGATR